MWPWRKRYRLSPDKAKVWGFTVISDLILAREGFIVYLDMNGDIDWRQTKEYVESNPPDQDRHSAVLNRAAELQVGWVDVDREKTLSLKWLIGEAIARSLDRDYVNAKKMLGRASVYRKTVLPSLERLEAIQEQSKIRDQWWRDYQLWSLFHYAFGIGAIVVSTFVAARPHLTGVSDGLAAWGAWLVAVVSGLLTFLTPDKRSDKFFRAWSILNSAIAKYKTDKSNTVHDVLDAYARGESIILEIGVAGGTGKAPAVRNIRSKKSPPARARRKRRP